MTLFTLLVIVLSTILINLLSDDSGSVNVSTQYTSPSHIKSQIPIKTKTLAEELAESKDAKFSFPVDEFFIQSDFKNYVLPKVKSFRLVVDRSVRYSFFVSYKHYLL